MDRRYSRRTVSSDDDGRTTTTVVRRYKVTAPGTVTHHDTSHRHSKSNHRATADYPQTQLVSLSSSGGGGPHPDVIAAAASNNMAMVYKKDWSRERHEREYIPSEKNRVVVHGYDRSVAHRRDQDYDEAYRDGYNGAVKHYHHQHYQDYDQEAAEEARRWEDYERANRGHRNYYRHTTIRRQRGSSVGSTLSRNSNDDQHQKRYMAEGALAGAGITALLQRRDEFGNLPEHRGRKVLVGAALGAIGAEALRRAKSAHESGRGSSDEDHGTFKKALGAGAAALAIAGTAQLIKNYREENDSESRSRSRSRSLSTGRRMSRSHHRRQRGYRASGSSAQSDVEYNYSEDLCKSCHRRDCSDHHQNMSRRRGRSRTRSRSRSADSSDRAHQRRRYATKIAAGTIATAALARKARHKRHSRSRSRSSSDDSFYVSSEEEERRRHENHRVAKVAAGTAATAAAARHLRNRSLSRSRSRSRIRTGAEVAGAGLIGAGAAKLYNKIRRRASSRNKSRYGSRSRSRSRSRSLSSPRPISSSHQPRRSRKWKRMDDSNSFEDDPFHSEFEYEDLHDRPMSHKATHDSYNRRRRALFHPEPTFSEVSGPVTEPDMMPQAITAGPRMSGALASSDDGLVPDAPVGRHKELTDYEANPIPMPESMSFGYGKGDKAVPIRSIKSHKEMEENSLFSMPQNDRARRRDHAITRDPVAHRQFSQDSALEADVESDDEWYITPQEIHTPHDLNIEAAELKRLDERHDSERQKEQGAYKRTKAKQRQDYPDADLHHERGQVRGFAQQDRHSRFQDYSPESNFDRTKSRSRSRSLSSSWSDIQSSNVPPPQDRREGAPEFKAPTISSYNSSPKSSWSPLQKASSHETLNAPALALDQEPTTEASLGPSTTSRQSQPQTYKPYVTNNTSAPPNITSSLSTSPSKERSEMHQNERPKKSETFPRSLLKIPQLETLPRPSSAMSDKTVTFGPMSPQSSRTLQELHAARPSDEASHAQSEVEELPPRFDRFGQLLARDGQNQQDEYRYRGNTTAGGMFDYLSVPNSHVESMWSIMSSDPEVVNAIVNNMESNENSHHRGVTSSMLSWMLGRSSRRKVRSFV